MREVKKITENQVYFKISKNAFTFSLVWIVLSFIGDWTFSLDKNSISIAKITVYVIFKLFAVVSILFICQASSFAINNRSHPRIKLFLQFFTTYFGIMLFFLLLTYPGAWHWDDLQLLDAAHHMTLVYWQHILSQVFISTTLYMIPFNFAPVLIQIFIISFIVANLMLKLSYHINTKAWLFLIPMLFPSIVYFNLTPMRMSLYSFVELLLFISVFFAHYENRSLSYAMMIRWGVLASLVCTWRSEGAIYFVAFPVALIILFYKRITFKQLTKYIAVFLVVLFSFSIPINKIQNSNKMYSDKYFITGTMRPLQDVLKTNFKDDTSQQDIEALNKVWDTNRLSSGSESVVSVFWSIKKWNFTQPEFENYKKIVVKLLINNPGAVLKGSENLFFQTSGIDGVAHVSSIDYSNQDSRWNNTAVQNYWNGTLSKPINTKIRRTVINDLRGVPVNLLTSIRPGPSQVTWIYPTFYNLFIPILICVIMFFILLFTRYKVYSLFFAALIVQSFVVFMTAPDNYFMYYLPIYVFGFSFTTVILLLWRNHKKDKGFIDYYNHGKKLTYSKQTPGTSLVYTPSSDSTYQH
ncbi:MAG: hypothetical protein QM613_02820 [Micrococcaceae bacterium]